MEKLNLPILRYFRYEHLPAHLQLRSRMFHDVAVALVDSYSVGDDIAELVVSLRKLLEAKDAAVRSIVR